MRDWGWEGDREGHLSEAIRVGLGVVLDFEDLYHSFGQLRLLLELRMRIVVGAEAHAEKIVSRDVL